MNKLRGIIIIALLSCFVVATWGCDMQRQAPAKPKVVRKKIVAPKPSTALARHSTPTAGPLTTAAKSEKSRGQSPVVKRISAVELRPKSDIAATPAGKKLSSLVAKNSKEPVNKPINTLPPQSDSASNRTAKKAAKASAKQAAVALEAQGPVVKKIQTQSTPNEVVALNRPAAEPVPSSAAVIQPATAPSPPKLDSELTPAPAATAAAGATANGKIADATSSQKGGSPAPYNPKGRINPFEPLFKDEPEVAPVMAKKKRRVPRTPLERIDLGQLKLVGIIMASSGNRALVQEASGKGYIIKEGTFIGLHSGKVTEIKKDRVVIKEEADDYVGTQKMRNKELVLPKPPGE